MNVATWIKEQDLDLNISRIKLKFAIYSEWKFKQKPIVIVGVGWPKWWGDSSGPTISDNLRTKLGTGAVILGGSEEPVGRTWIISNDKKLQELRENNFVIAIDNVRSNTKTTGTVGISHDSLCPGAGMGHRCSTPVGDISIVVSTHSSQFFDFSTQKTDLMNVNTKLSEILDRVLNDLSAEDADFKRCLGV